MRKVVTGAVVLCAVVAGALASEDKVSDIHTIMGKVNKKDGIHGKVKAAINVEKPDWDTAAKHMKDYKRLAADLGKNDPPAGEKKSWEKLTKEYVENVKKLDVAVDKKDKDAALKAHAAISKSCKACHDVHK